MDEQAPPFDQTQQAATSSEVAAPVVEEVVQIALEVDGDKATVDDMFFILEFQAGELDKNDAKVQLDMFRLIDRLVVGGIRGKGIPLNQLEAIMGKVGEELGKDKEIKN